MIKLKYIYIFIVFFSLSCHYHKDRLKIINNSTKEIWAVPFTKDVKKNSFYNISASCEIKSMETISPFTRSSIRSDLQEKHTNKVLYITFCSYEELDFVQNNLNQIIQNKKFKCDVYSLEELDSLNWIIKYNPGPSVSK